MRRRELFERTAGMTGLAALLAACGVDPADMSATGQTKPSTTSQLPVPELEIADTAFVEPWKSLIDDELISFGTSVLRISPETVDQAREALSSLPEGSSLIDRDRLFADCCRNDSRSGDVVVIDGWMVPVTLAGLAGALSQFKS
ncbi:MAG: hypothetical protein RL473_1400 [Actinomycetota bacterium]|jgi:hypothetical protein